MKIMAAMLIAALTAVLVSPAMDSRADARPRQPLTIAHRGASGYAPENTMPAFDQAVRMNADFIELDVQMSKDGQLVVIHDTTVDRTTDGTGAVGDLTWQQLRALDAGEWFAPEFAGARIPSLAEVLDRYGGKIGILIEMKAPWLYEGIERKVADEWRKRQMDAASNKGKVIVQSFDHLSVRRFHEILPVIPVGVLTYRAQDLTIRKLKEFASYADFVNPSLSLVTQQSVNRIHSYGMKVLAWTVTDPVWIAPLKQIGVDGIITDYPDFVTEFE